MINFEFHNPTKVIFGKNVEAEAGKEIKNLYGQKRWLSVEYREEILWQGKRLYKNL